MYIYNSMLLSHKKQGNSAIFNNMDKPRGLSKISQTEKFKYYKNLTYIWNLKKK